MALTIGEPDARARRSLVRCVFASMASLQLENLALPPMAPLHLEAAHVIEWRRRSFRDYWHRLSLRKTPGRPTLLSGIQTLIRQMSSANVLRGAPQIAGDLGKLGIEVAESTVASHTMKRSGPASPTWTAFLRAHLREPRDLTTLLRIA